MTGQIAIGLVGVLCIGALVYGVGMASATYRLADVGAWLSAAAKGMVVHANGLAGKVDGKTDLPEGMRGHRIRVVQDGDTVLLIDQDTGVVSRLDPSQLKITQSRRLGGVGLQVVVGSDTAYTVDPARGTVQRIDPVRLAPVGRPVSLAAPLGQAGMDGAGVLWVPEPQSGRLVPFQGGEKGTPVKVGEAGDRLTLTVAAGTPVVINASRGAASIVRDGAVQQIVLPPTVSRAPGKVRAPAETEEQTVPILDGQGSLLLLDAGVGQVSPISLTMPDHRYEPPNVLGNRVYLPDRTDGRLLVFNTATGKWERPMKVTGRGGAIELMIRDGLLWVNDPRGAFAFAVDREGAIKKIRKYDEKVPGSKRRPIPTQAPGGNGGRGAEGGGRGGGGGEEPGLRRPALPPEPPEPPVDGTPSAPHNLRVDPVNGGMKITYQPSVGGKPTGYVLKGDTAGLQVEPAEVPPGGPHQFTVNGGDCQKTYSFTVAVKYKDENGKATEKASPPSTPVRPCLAPGAPTNVQAKPQNHGATLTWSGTGQDVTYTLSVNGGTPTQVTSPHTVQNLANDRTHTLALTARNPAGTAPGGKTVQVDLSYPETSYRNAYNDQTNSRIRDSPGGGNVIATIPRTKYQDIPVICQTKGERVTEEQSNETSDVWDRIRYGGKIGYISDTLMKTPRGSYPAGGLYECEM